MTITRKPLHGLAVAALVAIAFAAGSLTRPTTALSASPQGRGPVPTPAPETSSVPREEGPLLYGGESGQSAAANGLIAVTGSYGVGTSVLYVLDTRSRQLAVYEARGGSPGSRRLVLVGARRIDLDLQLEGYKDESEFSYRDLVREFQRRGASGATGGSDGRSDTDPKTDPAKRGR